MTYPQTIPAAPDHPYMVGRREGAIPGALRMVPAGLTLGEAAQWALGFDDAKDERMEATYG